MFADQDDHRYLMLAAAVIAAGTLFRLFYAGLIPLVPDETNYWQWSRYLAAGYHDQAPMIAWLIRLSTTLFGQSEIAVRLPSVLALTVVAAYMSAAALRWFGSRAAYNTALIGQGMLAFCVGGVLATSDGIQAAAWAGAAYHVARGYEDNRWSQWLAGGFWFGFGMLSKYTMVIFLPGAFLFGLTSPMHRARLAQWRPYVAVALGSLLFAPVIWWNAQNNWNSVRHVAYIGGANEPLIIHWNFFGDYIASQAAFVTPVVFVLVLMAWVAVFRKRPCTGGWIGRYFAFTSLVMVGGFAGLSLHSRVYGNWPMAGYLTVGILVAACYGGGPESRRHRLWPWALGTSYLITGLIFLHAAVPFLPVPRHLDMTVNELSAWETLGAPVHAAVAKMPAPAHTFIFGLKYQMASELAFYTPGQPRTVSINRWDRPNVYDYWWRDEDLLGWDGVGVTESPYSGSRRLSAVFQRVDPPVAVTVTRRREAAGPGAVVRTFYIYRAYGFKGGLRWQPPNASSDIRTGE